MDIKIKIYRWSLKFVLDSNIISNAESLNFSEDINAWQGGLDIELALPFNDTSILVWDLIEYSIYNENYKNWLLKYSWVVNKIKRQYKWLAEWITLQCESLTKLLTDTEVDKTYTWTYQSIVNNIISDLPTNITSMDFVWNTLFKNLVQNTSSTSVVIDWNLLQALQKLFETWTFFINQFWEIKDTFTTKHILKFQTDIINNSTEEDSTWIISSDIIIWERILNINAGDLIKIQNTDTFLNLDNKQIKKLDFSILEKSIFIEKLEQLATK